MNKSLVVDCSKRPMFQDSAWDVEIHRRVGKVMEVERQGENLFLGSRKVRLVRSQEVDGGAAFSGVCQTMEPLNANVLDCLLENQELVPDGWQQYSTIIFLGTIEVSRENGRRRARGMMYDSRGKGQWVSCTMPVVADARMPQVALAVLE